MGTGTCVVLASGWPRQGAYRAQARSYTRPTQAMPDIHSLCGYALHKHVHNLRSAFADNDLRCAGQFVASTVLSMLPISTGNVGIACITVWISRVA